MGKLRPIQNSFSGGELSPYLSARSDLEIYHYGCELMRNWVALTQGPALTRGGTEYIQTIPDEYGRIFSFCISAYIGYMVIITPNTVYVADPDGLILEDQDHLLNPDFLQGSANWTDLSTGAATAIFTTGACQLSPGPTPSHVASISQQALGLEQGVAHILRVSTVSGEGEIEVSIGTTVGGSQIFSGTFSGSQPIEIDIPDGFPDPFITTTVAGGQTVKVLDKISVFGAVAPPEVSFPSPWGAPTIIADIQVAMPAGEDSMYIVSPEVQPYKLAFDKTTRVWTLTAVSFIGAPADWTGNNWPRTATFHQGRLWLAGTFTKPETFWASKSDEYENFTLGELADDALEYNIAKKGNIQWIKGMKNLLIGTDNSEFIVTSSAEIIVPGDIYVEQQSAYGSANTHSQEYGSDLLYISPDGRKLREMGYTWEEQGWISQDLTYSSEHLSLGDTFVGVVYAQNPASIIWLHTTSGNLIGCTYDKATKTVGWHKHETDGFILDIAVMEIGGHSELWGLVLRSDDGTMQLEKQNTAVGLDSFVRQEHTEPTNVIDPIPHLAEREVSLTVDGAVHPNITLDSLGAGVTQHEGTVIVVGLPFDSVLRTMRLDKGSPEGTGMGMTKRWNKLYVRMINSANPTINGRMPASRTAETPMNTRQPYASEDLEVSTLGYDDQGSITISQCSPMISLVAGIFGEISQS